MNICVFGGGGEPGRFGPDFCDRARSQGHTVYTISHQAHDHSVVADFECTEDVVAKFTAVASTANLDLVVYNTTAPSYPDQSHCFVAGHEYQEQAWMQTVRIHAAIPHAVGLSALRYMRQGTAVVFMTSGISWEPNRTYSTWAAGYAGGKAMQNHLMLAMAQHNNRGIIFTSISPHFTPQTYPTVFEKIYQHIMAIGPEHNGEICRIWN
jgi:NAD(P)-dependent dehydrogenase (short-subunit alcohol dehydrogenase family)